MKVVLQKRIGKKIFLLRLFLFPLIIFLQSCASSNVTREANDNVAVGYQNATSSFSSMGDGSVADTVENMSQTSKGVVLGGAAGAVAGGLTSGVGVVPGAATGAILGGAYGAYIDSNTSLQDKLENRGVKVIALGDQIMLVVRSNHIFNSQSAVISPGEYQTLDLVAKYINSFTTMTVRVAAYNCTTGTENIDRALSKEQAESVVRYLWFRGVNTRMITAAGMGSANPVASPSIDPEKSDNYRIEITMQKLPTSGTLG